MREETEGGEGQEEGRRGRKREEREGRKYKGGIASTGVEGEVSKVGLVKSNYTEKHCATF